MPLIIICGFPSSGKTTRALELKKYLEGVGKQVSLVTVHSLNIDKNAVYKDSTKEKSVRAALKAEVEKSISRENITILDSLNYIKGYRYELHCIVKSHKTLHCLVQTLCSGEECHKWNTARPSGESYDPEVLDGLLMRYEAPDSRNRWDSPLFSLTKDEKLPAQAINDALFERKAPPPNQSTMPTPLSSTNFLYELDKRTQEIITQLLAAQKTAVLGDKIRVDLADENIDYRNTWTLIELRRMKKQFISYAKLHPVEDVRKIGNMFVQFINNSVR